jgi:AcrR family transcriptional regulator
MASLYQYFPDKRGVMAALFERHADEVRSGLTRSLAGAESLEDLLDRFAPLLRRYFQVHRENPAVRSLWAAVQVDPKLQALDAADSLRTARLFYDACRPFYGQVDEPRLMAACALAMQLCASAAQFALALPEEIAAASADAYAEMVVHYLKVLRPEPSG